ncbi:MAG: ABC transporter substrate-binding protein, partial [Dehalococcoidia bacterium]
WWNDVLDTVETPDERTITFHLKAVDAWTFSTTNAGSPIGGSILPVEHARDPALMDANLVGSGMYELVDHAGGTNFRLNRNENYRVPGTPKLAAIQWKLIQAQAAALAAFSAQEIDTVAPSNKLEKDQLVQQHGDDIEIDSELSRAIWTVLARGDGQWADPRVAKAISMALNKEEMISLMAFGDGQASGPVPPTFVSYALTEDEIAETYGKFDPGEANKLLDAAGFDRSQKYDMKFIVPGDTLSQFAQICQSQLQENLGLDIKLVGEDFGKWLGQSLYGGDFNGFITYPSLAYDDPSSYIGGYSFEIGGRPNWAGFHNETLDTMVKQQKATLDDTEREALVKEIQLKAWEFGAPFIPTFVRVTYGAWWRYVRGRVIGRGSYGYLVGNTYVEEH